MSPITLSTVDRELTLLASIRTETDASSEDLKEVIQQLFEIQSAVHGYLGAETQAELVRKM